MATPASLAIRYVSGTGESTTVERFAADGTSLGVVASTPASGMLHAATAERALLVPSDGSPVACVAGEATLWQVDGEDVGGLNARPRAAGFLPDGRAYLAFYDDFDFMGAKEIRIAVVTEGGGIEVVAHLTSADLPELAPTNNEYADISGATLSSDGSVLHLLLRAVGPFPLTRLSSAYLVGLDTATWQVAYHHAYDGVRPRSSVSGFYITRVPGSESLLVSGHHPLGQANTARVARLDFDAGLAAEPSEAWTADLAPVFADSQVAVAGGRAYVAVVPPAAGGRYAIALDLADGGEVWAAEADAGLTIGGVSIGVVDDAVLVGVYGDFATFPDSPGGYGVLRLDAASGTTAAAGAFPLATLDVADMAGVPGEPNAHDFIVNPATPPDTASYDCAAPNAVAVEWCANPPPEYSDPAVPWPMAPEPDPDPSGDAVLYLTYRTEDGAEVAAFDDNGNRLWTEASPGDPERVVARPEQALVVSYDGGDVWRVLRSHPAAEGWRWDWNVDTRIHDAAVTRAGEVYVATREGDEVQVRRVHPGDGEVVVALTPLDDLGERNGSPVSLALTSDDAFLYVLMVSDDGTASYLLCFDLVGRELWWTRNLTNASAEQSQQARVRRVPGGGDDIVLTYLEGNGPDLRVMRFEVAAPGEWPEAMWSASLSSSFGYLAGMAVNASGVYVAHYDYNDPARVVALNLGNGGQMWASDLSATTTSPWGVEPLNNGLAATDDHVYVALYGADVLFPDRKQGFVRLDAATGALAPAGEFPLEVYQARQADAVASDEDDPIDPM